MIAKFDDLEPWRSVDMKGIVAPEISPKSFGTFEKQGLVSRNSRELFGPEKPFVKLRPAYSVKLVFSYDVKGTKIKITAKFRATRRLPFEDTKRIMSPEMCPKSFGTFEKRAPSPWPDLLEAGLALNSVNYH